MSVLSQFDEELYKVVNCPVPVWWRVLQGQLLVLSQFVEELYKVSCSSCPSLMKSSTRSVVDHVQVWWRAQLLVLSQFDVELYKVSHWSWPSLMKSSTGSVVGHVPVWWRAQLVLSQFDEELSCWSCPSLMKSSTMSVICSVPVSQTVLQGQLFVLPQYNEDYIGCQ